jgi:hypothetical protein
MTHPDRTADRPPHLCAAYGCPLLGTMNASTTGGADWFCFAHFGRDFGQRDRVTRELRQLDWLSNAVVDIRRRHLNRSDWPAQYQRICHDLQAQGRDDLRFTGSPHQRMDTERWVEKLEAELATQVRALVKPDQEQAALPTEFNPNANFARVEFEVPA